MDNRHILFSFLLFTVIAYLSGCASNKPNVPYVGPYPLSFKRLENRNPLLSKELGKLPEIQDGISENEKVALEQLILLYEMHPNKFDKAFYEMYKIGLPNHRKYCSPLQTLFWLVIDKELHDENDLLSNFSLEKFLDSAWNFDFTFRFDLSKDQILKIINGINKKEEKERYLRAIKYAKMSDIQHMMLLEFKARPNLFSRRVRKIIKQSLISKNYHRWDDFEVVVERLNAPELIDYYERARIGYSGLRSLTLVVSPQDVFENNTGACVTITRFTIYCLKKAGYKARELRVDSPTNRGYHTVCLFEVDGEKYIMDNGRPDQLGISPYSKYNPKCYKFRPEPVY